MRRNRSVAIGVAALLLLGATGGCRDEKAGSGTTVTREVPSGRGGAGAGDNAAAPPGNDNAPRVIPFRKGPPPQELPGSPGGERPDGGPP